MSLLNRYFTTMTTILHKHGATIDKFIGDSIMAFWGAPLPQADHARRAVLAAAEMHAAIARLQQELAAEGLPATDLGIGINSGMVNVGNMGSDYRLAYTVIGDAVNLASRLERLTRTYQVPTIVGEGTAASVSDYLFLELDTLLVKGKSNKVRIYEPLGPRNGMKQPELQLLEQHQAALDLYYARKDEAAAEQFRILADTGSRPGYYKYMLEKMAADMVTPG